MSKVFCSFDSSSLLKLQIRTVLHCLLGSISFKFRILLILSVDEYDRMHSIIAKQGLERPDGKANAMLVAEERSVMNQNIMAGMKDCRQNHIHMFLNSLSVPSQQDVTSCKWWGRREGVAIFTTQDELFTLSALTAFGKTTLRAARK